MPTDPQVRAPTALSKIWLWGSTNTPIETLATRLIDDFWTQVWKVHLSIILRENVREGKRAWKNLLEFWIMLPRNCDLDLFHNISNMLLGKVLAYFQKCSYILAVRQAID